MQGFSSRRIAMVGAIAATALFARTADAQRYVSRSHGPTFGVSGAVVGLTGDIADGPSISGGGVQLEVGWFFRASHLGVLMDYVTAGIDDNGPPALKNYSHIGVTGRYLFRDDRNMLRPYVELGLTRREATARLSGALPRTASTHSLGGSLGLGAQLFLARSVALDLGGQVGLGTFSDWESNDTPANLVPLKPGSSTIRLGLRLWPGY